MNLAMTALLYFFKSKMVNHLIQATRPNTRHSLCPVPLVQQCVLPIVIQVPFPLAPGQWVQLMNYLSFSILSYCAKKREAGNGSWETLSISDLDHPSTGAWLFSTHTDERQNSHSEEREDLLSCFNCFAGCVYQPINYLSLSFNSLDPRTKLQTMIPIWLFRVMEIAKLSSSGEHQAV
jgi:hypothetical protein